MEGELFMKKNRSEAEARLARFEETRRKHPEMTRGFKWFSPQGDISVEDAPAWFVEYARRSRIIFLVRTGLSREVSRLKKDKTKAFECLDETCVRRQRQVRVHVDPATIQELLDISRDKMADLFAFFAKAVPPQNLLWVAYSHLVANTTQQLSYIFNHLNLDPERYILPSFEHQAMKMGHLTPRHDISNPDEIAHALAGTMWDGAVDAPEYSQ